MKKLEFEGTTQEIQRKTLFRNGMVVVTTLIGSGFASGQETMQYFTAYGTKGLMGILLAMLGFAVVTAILLKFGQKFKEKIANEVYDYFFGRYLGAFTKFYIPFFAFMVGVVMISGAGATMNEYFKIPTWMGTIIMAACVLVATFFGLHRLVTITSRVTPITIGFCLFVVLYTFASGDFNFHGVDSILENSSHVHYAVGQDTRWWWLSAINYVGVNYVCGIPFFFALGKYNNSQKEAKYSGLMGGILLMITAGLINIALLGHTELVLSSEIPMLALANRISFWAGGMFALIMLEEIFSTSASLVWSVTDALTRRKTSQKRERLTMIAVVLAILVGGQFPFGKLVNLFYPFTGWLGVVLCFAIIGHGAYDWWLSKSKYTMQDKVQDDAQSN